MFSELGKNKNYKNAVAGTKQGNNSNHYLRLRRIAYCGQEALQIWASFTLSRCVPTLG